MWGRFGEPILIDYPLLHLVVSFALCNGAVVTTRCFGLRIDNQKTECALCLLSCDLLGNALIPPGCLCWQVWSRTRISFCR